jgi:hypothetical protein
MRLSALRAGRFLLSRRLLVIISVRDCVNLRALVLLEELGELKKNSITSLGIVPATFQLVT